MTDEGSNWGWEIARGNLMGRRNLLAFGLTTFLLVAGVGAATSYLVDSPTATIGSGSNGEMLARLKAYTRSIGTAEPASTAAAGKLLPDVHTMIERLVARLETTPGDIKGWQMLGWSYFHTGLYEQAAIAYAKALELDPNSAEIKLSHEQARAKSSKPGASLQTAAVRNGGDEVHVATKSKVTPARPYDAAIRSMVDGLANRLEQSPRDAEGWTRLMRSRVVLGEREVAAKAFRKALEIFKDDQAASGAITAAAVELGLKAK
jgi:cytochrome c-type biogenesis protein CcmH